MRRLASRRGAVSVVAALALVTLIAVSLAASVAVVAAHAARVTHQEDGLQALYLAEMGVEETLARHASGETPETLWRVVERGLGPEVPAGGEVSSSDEIAPGGDSRLAVGSYEVTARGGGGALVISSRGLVATPAGRSVEREVRVECRRAGGKWHVEKWERVP